MSVAVIYDDLFLKHNLESHPENAQRLVYFLKSLRQLSIPVVKPSQVSYDLLKSVHSENYIQDVMLSCREKQEGFFDPDTYFCPFTFDTAMMSAGAVEKAVELAISGRFKAVFCAVRPPGHHAERDRAMGFCIFNNIAVGAKKALAEGAERVLIVDFDAHHGNGTQHAFEETPNVFYFSTHQFPFYPGTGSAEENRENILNIPMPAGSGDQAFKEAYGKTYPEVLRRFKPDIVLVSAGYDLHRDDPLTSLSVTDGGLSFILRSILEHARGADAPVVFALEGGYNLHTLSRAGYITFKAMLETFGGG